MPKTRGLIMVDEIPDECINCLVAILDDLIRPEYTTNPGIIIKRTVALDGTCTYTVGRRSSPLSIPMDDFFKMAGRQNFIVPMALRGDLRVTRPGRGVLMGVYETYSRIQKERLTKQILRRTVKFDSHQRGDRDDCTHCY